MGRAISPIMNRKPSHFETTLAPKLQPLFRELENARDSYGVGSAQHKRAVRVYVKARAKLEAGQ